MCSRRPHHYAVTLRREREREEPAQPQAREYIAARQSCNEQPRKRTLWRAAAASAGPSGSQPSRSRGPRRLIHESEVSSVRHRPVYFVRVSVVPAVSVFVCLCEIRVLREEAKMAPASVLDWTEPRQQWRYPKARPELVVKTQSTIELSDKEADTAYKKICKFLRRLRSKKCEQIPAEVARG